MTIFDYLKELLVDKKGNLPLEQYSPYIINRWLSFIHPEIALTISETCSNQELLADKERHYKTLLCLLPKTKRVNKINYVKKIKEKEKEKDQEENKIKILADNMEISQREIIQLKNLLVDAI